MAAAACLAWHQGLAGRAAAGEKVQPPAKKADAQPASGSEPCRYKEARGPFEVQAAAYDWVDAKRKRPVPAKIYFPKSGDGPFPVVIFSHGLGGTRDGYEYLGRHWASHGYVCVHVQHKGSDNAAWENQPDPMASMKKAVLDVKNSTERPKDVSFAIDQMEKMNADAAAALKGRLDIENIGVAGHSFGAFTVLAAAGEVYGGPLGLGFTFTDPRVKAGIPMSTPVPFKQLSANKAFGRISIPCLHMTGTRDDSPVGDTMATDRRIPYDGINGADQYLVTFTGGDHMIFSGRGALPGGEKDAFFQNLIRMSTTAFWDAYLKNDPKAKEWLAKGGCDGVLGKDAVLEKKLK